MVFYSYLLNIENETFEGISQIAITRRGSDEFIIGEIITF